MGSTKFITAGVVALAGAAIVGATIDRAGPGSIELTVKDRSNGNASIAARGTFVALAWAATTPDGVTDVYTATSRDAGRTFGRPNRVNHAPGHARVSGEQPPRVALVARPGRQPSIVVVWTAKGAGGTRLVSARSDDGAASFSSATPLPGTDASGNRGWESVTVDRDGHVVVIWLHHRELAEPGASSTSMHHDGQAHTGHGNADGVERAQRSKLYFTRLDGSDGAHALTGGVCYCCKTALAAAADGSVYAAWRHVYPGNIRDIAFARSRDGGRPFDAEVRVSDDHWVLDGCPENGPALAVDERSSVHVVWPTLLGGSTTSSESTLALFYAASRDGRQFSPRQRIPTEGTPRHPQIALSSRESLVVAWDEQIKGTRRIVVADGVADDRGTVRLTRHPIVTAERGEYPALAAANEGYVIAWTSGPPAQSVIRVERMTRRE